MEVSYFLFISTFFPLHFIPSLFLLVPCTLLQNHLILCNPVGLSPLNFISNTFLGILFVPRLFMWSDHCIYFSSNSVNFVFVPVIELISVTCAVSFTESVLLQYCHSVHFRCSSVLKWSLNKTLFFILRIHLSTQTFSFLCRKIWTYFLFLLRFYMPFFGKFPYC